MSSQDFAIRCPSCDATLRLRREDLGTERACPKCQATLQIPGATEAAQRAAKEDARDEFSFLCKLCATRLYARPSQIGELLACPDCDTPNVIPAPDKPRPRTQPVDDGDDYQLAPAEDRPPPVVTAEPVQMPPAPTVEPVRFTCIYCNALLYADVDQIGTVIECPDCQAKVKVPQRRKAVSKPRVVADPDARFEMSPAAEREPEASIAEGLMTAAHEKVIEKEKEDPDPPQEPFGLDVYLFPFQPMVAAYGVILWGLFSVVAYLASVAVSTSGLGMIFGLVMMIGSILLIVAAGALGSMVMTNIVTWAALGYQRIVEWPAFEIFDWVRRGLLIFNSLAVSAAPGAFVAYLIPGGIWRSVFPVTSAYVLFPIVMLSMVSEESPFVPFSRFIWASLRKVRSSWMALYSHAAVLLVAVTVPVVLELTVSHQWSYITVAVGVYAGLVYFRLLGRLAYVIDEAMAGFDDEDDNEEPRNVEPEFSHGETSSVPPPPPIAADAPPFGRSR